MERIDTTIFPCTETPKVFALHTIRGMMNRFVSGGIQVKNKKKCCLPRAVRLQCNEESFAKSLPWEVAHHSSPSPRVRIQSRAMNAKHVCMFRLRFWLYVRVWGGKNIFFTGCTFRW